MKKVYAVVQPNAYYYGDRCVEKVFDTECKANKFIQSKEVHLEIDEWEVQ